MKNLKLALHVLILIPKQKESSVKWFLKIHVYNLKRCRMLEVVKKKKRLIIFAQNNDFCEKIIYLFCETNISI